MYEHHDAVVVRAAAFPAHVAATGWPDLDACPESVPEWRDWLGRALRIPGFSAALEQASPILADRAVKLRDGQDMPVGDARRVVMAVMRYLLRAASRATPFGLFAGIAPARIGSRPELRAGTAHQAVLRPDALWLTALARNLEADLAVLRHVTVAASNLAVQRDGYLILAQRPGEGNAGIPETARVRSTPPVATALALAAVPVAFADLVGKLAAEFPQASAEIIEAMLASLVRERFLVTALRPPKTETDPLGYLTRVLAAPGGNRARRASDVAARLAEAIAAQGAQPADTVPAGRARMAVSLTGACADPAPRPTADLLLDWAITLPASVASEAARAASALARLAPLPCLSAGWVAWHGMFLERYGPRAVVPVLDALDACTGLGYPAGYQDGLPAAVPAVTARDRKLLALAQTAALLRTREVVVDDAMIKELTVPGDSALVQPASEITVRVAAPTLGHLARGDFALAVTGVSRGAGITTGRFLGVLPPDDRDRMTGCYMGLPTATDNALRVQVSAPPRYPRAGSVARAPQLTRHVIRLGEPDTRGDAIRIQDIAVTADQTGIWLTWLPGGQVIEPVAFNAVEPVNFAHPLARFLTEAPQALRAPCAPFDWGAASALPFLPALRYGKTLLAPTLWRLDATALPGKRATQGEWDATFTAWCQAVNLPAVVAAGTGDQRIRLQLAVGGHRALLRDELDRTGTLTLRPAPATDDAGWAGGHAHEVTVPLGTTARPVPAPCWLAAARTAAHGDTHLPFRDGRLYVKVYASVAVQDEILARHLPRLAAGLGQDARWWFLRYHDPGPHLRLRVMVPDAMLAAAAAQVAEWCEQVRRAGLASRVQWDTYYPETARFGGPLAMHAAEACFAADSAAVLAQLAACANPAGPDPRSLIAASMLDFVGGFAGATEAGMAWLIARRPSAVPAVPRGVYDQAVCLASPRDPDAVRALPGGSQIMSAWNRRRDALAAYRKAVDETSPVPALSILPDLLHLHYARMAGADRERERTCVHLARAAALSCTARKGKTP